MNQTQALAKLRKVLGPKVGCRINEKALPADEREEARVKLRMSIALLNETEEDLDRRRKELLSKDDKYMMLCRRADELRAEKSRLISAANHYRITVVVAEAMFNSVKAEGDNWDEVVHKVVSSNP